MNLQIRNAESRSFQIAVTTTISRNPSCPLRRIQDRAMLPHLIWHPIATPFMTIDVDVQRVSAFIPSCANVDLVAYGEDALFAIMVSTAGVRVERGGTRAIS